jgi:integrase
VLRLETSKNGEKREVPMTDTVHALITECAAGKEPDDYLFTRNGRPVLDFRDEWKKLCSDAGVTLLVHDLRRTAARNLRRAGVAEGVIMKIGGWKTRSVFERYNIVNAQDMREALGKLKSHKNSHNSPQQNKTGNGHGDAGYSKQ